MNETTTLEQDMQEHAKIVYFYNFDKETLRHYYDKPRLYQWIILWLIRISTYTFGLVLGITFILLPITGYLLDVPGYYVAYLNKRGHYTSVYNYYNCFINSMDRKYKNNSWIKENQIEIPLKISDSAFREIILKKYVSLIKDLSFSKEEINMINSKYKKITKNDNLPNLAELNTNIKFDYTHYQYTDNTLIIKFEYINPKYYNSVFGKRLKVLTCPNYGGGFPTNEEIINKVRDGYNLDGRKYLNCCGIGKVLSWGLLDNKFSINWK